MTNSKQTEKQVGKKVKKKGLNYSKLRKAVLTLRAVSHTKIRQPIISLLQEHEPLTVTEIYMRAKLNQSVASQHLAILRRAGVVKTERDGKFVHYSLDKKELAKVADCVKKLAKLYQGDER